ncbi:GLPGLI family protein [Epilithonimonas xixisoli]|uniref:GLPGLI family protein n=1 Tax=Epilithonimonas xixisoli TaxID=1476462 RepID=A0A4R8I6L7_9FLAO|nr:GLPGLI family protein [Epilithonimonas xixisoli]TDX84613.1 GLPGLI family protein [Epilithonimonas xixisoli]
MKKILALSSLLILISVNSQVHRFYYELTYKPNKDSATTEKEMMVLDVAKDESLFLPYKQLEYDSVLTANIKKAREFGAEIDKELMTKKPPLLSYRISKFKDGNLGFKDFIGISEYYIYSEKPNLKWNITNEKEKIEIYNAQKATTNFGGRSWIAWFTTDIPIQDGPYKFSGLPGLVIKLEDSGNNYSWILKGNKKLTHNIEINKLNYLESQMGEAKKIPKSAFEKRSAEYRKNPMSQMLRSFDEKDVELMKKLKEEETRLKKQISFYNNPIEVD